MNKREAIQAMLCGEKVTKTTLLEDQFIEFCNGSFLNQHGNLVDINIYNEGSDNWKLYSKDKVYVPKVGDKIWVKAEIREVYTGCSHPYEISICGDCDVMELCISQDAEFKKAD